MKIKSIRIANFRSLEDVYLEFEADTTVLIGENNTGKTSFLDALKILLQKTPSKGNPFHEYDFNMSKSGDSPEKSNGIVLEVWFCEGKTDEWPLPLAQSLDDIIQTDVNNDIDMIGLRLTSKFDAGKKEFITEWKFLNINGEPLVGKGATVDNFRRFYRYIKIFYLSALRDSAAEFSPRSQFWGNILRDLKIKEELVEELQKEFKVLNEKLLASDPRLEKVRGELDKAQKVLSLECSDITTIQALPVRPWDIMSKCEVTIKGRGNELDFPLNRHGQGTQSLSVLFLFQAFVEVLLKPTFEPETEAILALEEPESHLHPQAIRALASNLIKIKGQKIISTHSPYFIQEVPLRNIRMFRRCGSRASIHSLEDKFLIAAEYKEGLGDFCKTYSSKFTYDANTSHLILRGVMEEEEFRKLAKMYSGNAKIVANLVIARNRSKLFLSDDELSSLDTFAKRIRGEVLFARGWLLCEGQSEYTLIRYFADLLETSLDEAGISVIDFQNNGSPGIFVALAKTFQIPWVMICDHDAAGLDFEKQVMKRGVVAAEAAKKVRKLPVPGSVLEDFLVGNGFRKEFVEIAVEAGQSLTKKEGEEGFDVELSAVAKSDKTGFAVKLVGKLMASKADAGRVPDFFKDAIKAVIAEAK